MRCRRDALIAALVLFLVSAAANTVLFTNASASRRRILEDFLRSHAAHAASVIDAATHARIAVGSGDSTLEYRAELEKLHTIRRTYPIIQSLYTIHDDGNGNLRLVLESTSSTSPRQAGEAVKMADSRLEEILQALRRGESYVSEEETFGLRVMTPLTRLGAGALDFIVAEVSPRDLEVTLASIRSAYHLSLVVSLGLALIGGVAFYVLRMREVVARQMSPGEDAFFRKITAVLPGMLYQARVSPLGRIKLTYASDASRWVFEVEPESLRDNPGAIYRLIHPHDREYLRKKMIDVIKNSDTWREEFRVMLPKAGLQWRLGVAHVERLADGSSLWHGFVTDTTWRKAAEDVMRKSEASLKAAQQVASMGSWELDLTDPDNINANSLRWSDESFRIFGLEPDTPITNDLFFKLVHPDDRDAVSKAVTTALTNRSRYSIDHRIIRPDGQERHVHEDAVIMLDEKTGKPIAMIGTVHDITERKHREEAIRLNEQRLKLATQAGRVGTWDYDVATKKIYWNDVMYVMKKLDLATFDPNLQASESLLHPEDHDRVMAEFNRCLTSNETRYEVECRLILRDGEILHTRSSAEIIRDSRGRAIRCVGIEIDVTAEKRAVEAAIAADRAKSEFLAMMSHEIRTPMNGVLGFTTLLKETPLAKDQKEYVSTIEASGQHLLHLINDILDLSKIESGRIKIHSSPLALRPFLEELFTLLRPRAQEKHLDYRLIVYPGVPEVIVTDRTRLGQILTNLLGNAVKFTDSGSVHMMVHSTKHKDGSGLWEWHFEVSDTGCGIPDSVLSKIFEPFYQADLSATRRHGGTGLGLAISHRLAKLLDGDITVTREQSPPGSKFVATIRAPTGTLPSDISTEETLKRFPGKKILIVDDDPIGRKLCQLQLAKFGFQTHIAENGLVARNICDEEKFDVILMDVQMPEMDGFTATREIRKREKTRTPIIALTANAMPDDREKSLECGMDDYVSKPLNMNVLIKSISRWV